MKALTASMREASSSLNWTKCVLIGSSGCCGALCSLDTLVMDLPFALWSIRDAGLQAISLGNCIPNIIQTAVCRLCGQRGLYILITDDTHDPRKKETGCQKSSTSPSLDKQPLNIIPVLSSSISDRALLF